MEALAIEEKELGDFVLKGQIKSFQDYELIKDSIDDHIVQGCESITLNIEDSMGIISSVIGYLIKLVNMQKVKVFLFVKEDALFTVLDNLGLVHAFNVRKISLSE